jgi:hypothetical protein
MTEQEKLELRALIREELKTLNNSAKSVFINDIRYNLNDSSVQQKLGFIGLKKPKTSIIADFRKNNIVFTAKRKSGTGAELNRYLRIKKEKELKKL